MLQPKPCPLLPRFERVDTVYKTVNGTPISTAILIPKTLDPKSAQKSCPLLVHFHGGGLYTGTNPEPYFLSNWVLELAEAKDAIVVSPAYRLLPEANGSDILKDVQDFWEWVHKSLPSFVAQKWHGLTVDLGRIATTGESAGGFLALQSAYLFPSANIKVVMAQYCALYPDIEWYPQPSSPPTEANAFIDAYLSTLEPGAIRLSSPFPAMLEFGGALKQAGRHREFMGDDKRLKIDHCLQTAEKIPPIWIMQGIDDSMMPKSATDELVARIREKRPETELLYSVQPGDHGFDSTHGLNEPYIAEGIELVTKYWP